ncbi:MAG: phosphatidylserine/phosphatidylglycerophosphate/cardiolipin synthase family protein [Candidatus Sericytochromatia bacterium]|nr:phosphatidylserine/phosphatidylglycerophosphate/cardiolipin synthase family protein [Candidatus Tanganyikabacteria bacterium]
MAQRGRFILQLAVATTVLAGCGLGVAAPPARIQTGTDAKAFARSAASDIARQTGADAGDLEAYIESQQAELTDLARRRTALPAGGGEPGAEPGAGPLTLPPSAQATVNAVDTLINADRIFAAIEESVRGARKRIQLDLFMLGGRYGSRLAQAIEDRRQAGVDVRIVLDGHFAAMGPAHQQAMSTATFLRDHQMPVRTFPLDSLIAPKGLAKASLIDHNKIVIADDTAYIGGANLIDVADTNHDLMFRIHGPVAAEISQWVDATFDKSTYPAIWSTGKAAKAPPALPAPTYRPATAVPAGANSRVALTRTDRTEHSTYDRLLARIKTSAKIDVGVFELDDETLKAELINAKKRGAQVRILLDRHQMDHKYTGKKAPAGIPNWLAVRDFLAAGLPVHWYDPSLPFEEMHLKMAIFDDRVSVVGSTNFTTRAFLNYRETGIEVEGGQAVADLVAMFEADWRSHSTPVTTLTAQQRALAATIAFLNKGGIGWW